MKLRILDSQWTPFVNALCDRRDVETAGIILAERLHGGEVLYARELIVMPDDGYTIRRADQLRIDPVMINRLVRPARDRGLSVLTVHTHPRTTGPWFSAADDMGDSRLIPSLLAQMPGPHGSIVVAGDTGKMAGRVWSESGAKAELGVRIVGQTIRTSPIKLIGQGNDNSWFDRQGLALGEVGQAALRDLHVTIVGLGGTGSVAFVQLAHLGIGRITVVDGDRVERSNVSRILGATSRDAGVAWKVDVAARYAEQLGLGTRVTVVRGNLGSGVSIAEIEASDIILSCVDKHMPRALLNRLAYEKALPMIDMGTSFRVDGKKRIVAGAGRVVVVGPGRRCLGCWGHIDPQRLRIESLSATDRAKEVADGYIDGAEVPQPSVVAFNTMIAGAAVVELMRLVTGFAGTDDPPVRLSFDFVAGTVRRNSLAGVDACSICLRESTAHEKNSECLKLAGSLPTALGSLT